MKRHHKGKSKLWLLIILLLVAAAGFIALDLLGKNEDRERTAGLTDAPIERLTLYDGGKAFYLRNDITTYLVMGTDETTESVFQYEDQNLNNRQADFIMLMIVDRSNKTYSALHLNRDTMMDIRRLDDNGNPAGTAYAHLNNAHSFGSGGKDSCRNVSEAVSRLLYSVPVDHYLAITMDGIPLVADLVNGVPVTIEEDLTKADPAFKVGAVITLNGEQALRFVRARTSVSDGTNLSRMSRQRSFIQSLREQIDTQLKEDDEFALKFADAISPYVTSDLTTNELAKFADQMKDYDFRSIDDIKGQANVNYETGYTEFHVDMDALKKQVIELFFTPNASLVDPSKI